jgi:hypothetical protein
MKARYRRSKRIGSSDRKWHRQTGDEHVYSVAHENQEQTYEWAAMDDKKLIVAEVEQSPFENCAEKPIVSWPLHTSIRASVGRHSADRRLRRAAAISQQFADWLRPARSFIDWQRGHA